MTGDARSPHQVLVQSVAMQIEYVRLKSFRAFKDVTLRDLPRFCVLVGANGSGKSTLLSVFGFLRDAMNSNVTAALGRLGGKAHAASARISTPLAAAPPTSGPSPMPRGSWRIREIAAKVSSWRLANRR